MSKYDDDDDDYNDDDVHVSVRFCCVRLVFMVGFVFGFEGQAIDTPRSVPSLKFASALTPSRHTLHCPRKSSALRVS